MTRPLPQASLRVYQLTSPALGPGIAAAQVVQQGEGWYCEHDGRTYPDMVRRYVMQAKCIDASGEATLSVFDDQARPLDPLPRLHSPHAAEGFHRTA